MLYISLILSLSLLVLVNWIVARSRYRVPKTIAVCLGFAFGPVFLMVFFPVVFWQAVVMCGTLLIVAVTQRGRRLYLPVSCAATVVAYVILMYSAVEDHRTLAQIKQQYPFESIEDRMPIRASRNSTLPSADVDRLSKMEIRVALANGWPSWRNATLQRLHEDSVNVFVENAGFGLGRMRSTDSKTLKNGLPERPSVAQPDYHNLFVPPTGDLSATLRDWDATKMTRLHDDGVLDFVNPMGFGYAKDRQRVAGFQKHGMTKVPMAETVWTVAHLDLVGLVVHENPVAYISANLPQMEELRAAPTRPLDAFETEALESLRRGEDLFVRGADNKGRMLGAIRAAKQCVVCHGGDRGDLLGAFSYGLRKEK